MAGGGDAGEAMRQQNLRRQRQYNQNLARQRKATEEAAVYNVQRRADEAAEKLGESGKRGASQFLAGV